MLGPLLEETSDALGVVVGGEAGVGDTEEGVEDLPVGGALVSEDAAVVEVGEAGDVPGVGGVLGAALADVAGEAFQRRGAEEVHLGPGPALDPVDGTGPGVREVGAAVASVLLDERPGQNDGTSAVVCRLQAGVFNGDDGQDAAVVEPLPAGAQGAMDEDAVAGGVAASAVSPGGPGQLRARDVPRGPEASPEAVGEVFTVGMGDGEDGDAGGAVGGDVVGGGVGQGFAGGVGGAEVVLPAVLGADALAGGDVPGPVMGECPAFGGFELATVLGEGWCGDPPAGGEAGEFGAQSSGPHRLSLVGIAEAPQAGVSGGSNGGKDDLSVGGGNLGNLVEDHDGARGGAFIGECEAGDCHRRDPGLTEFSRRLVGGGQPDHRATCLRGGHGGGVDHGGLAEPSRRDHATDSRSGGAQGPRRVGLVGSQPWLLLGDSGFNQHGVDARDASGDQLVEKVQHLLLQGEVVDGRVLGRPSPRAVHQADCVP